MLVAAAVNKSIPTALDVTLANLAHISTQRMVSARTVLLVDSNDKRKGTNVSHVIRARSHLERAVRVVNYVPLVNLAM